METAAFPDERTVDALRQATNLSQTASPPDNHGAVLDFNPFPGLVKNRLLQAQTKTSSDPPRPPPPHRRSSRSRGSGPAAASVARSILIAAVVASLLWEPANKRAGIPRGPSALSEFLPRFGYRTDSHARCHFIRRNKSVLLCSKSLLEVKLPH